MSEGIDYDQRASELLGLLKMHQDMPHWGNCFEEKRNWTSEWLREEFAVIVESHAAEIAKLTKERNSARTERNHWARLANERYKTLQEMKA